MNNFNPHIAGDLRTLFDISRQVPTGETLEQIRQNYYIAAKMHGDDSSSIGGLNINMSGRTDMAFLDSDKKKKREHEDLVLTLMIHNMTIQQIDERLAAQYGENFAEDLAAEYLDEETYKRLMEIEDQTERRRQIAIELNKGIQDGTIDTDKIHGNSDFEGWLGAHEIEEQCELERSRSNVQLDDSYPDNTNDAKVEGNHNLTEGNEESAFNAIFADNGPIVK